MARKTLGLKPTGCPGVLVALSAGMACTTSGADDGATGTTTSTSTSVTTSATGGAGGMTAATTVTSGTADSSSSSGMGGSSVGGAGGTGGGGASGPCGPAGVNPVGFDFDLGHSGDVILGGQENDRLLSHDALGHWILWSVSTRTIVASGEAPQQCHQIGGLESCAHPIVQLAGNHFLIQVNAVAEIRDTSDGHLLSTTTVYPNLPGASSMEVRNFGLASDGSYVWVGSSTALDIRSPAGATLTSHPGNYFDGAFVATPQSVFVGRFTTQTVERIDAATGVATQSPAFSGTFFAWFTDGAGFITKEGTTVRAYTADAVQKGILSTSGYASAGGAGDLYWVVVNGQPFNVYSLSQSGALVSSFPGYQVWYAAPSRDVVALINDKNKGGIVRLDPSGPTATHVDFRIRMGLGFAADTAGNWTVASTLGGVYSSGTFSNGEPPLSCGRAIDVTASQNGDIAVTTERNTLLFTLDASGLSFKDTLPARANRAEFSANGAALAYTCYDDIECTDLALHVATYPGLVSIFDSPPNPIPKILSFADDASIIAWAQGVDRKVTDLANATTIYSDPAAGGVFISPDGTRLAVVKSNDASTQVFTNGVLSDAFTGAAVGWIDNERVIIGGTAIRNVQTFTNTATISVPCTKKGFRALDATHVYCPSTNAVYDLTTNQPVWSGSAPVYIGAAVTNGYAFVPQSHFLSGEAVTF